MDLLSAFPRSAMSQSQLNTVKWFAEMNGNGRDLPSVKKVSDHREDILDCAGANTQIAEGSLGNVYCVNNIGEILAHEWANPLVRPHITDYPVDPGDGPFDRAAHGARWYSEVDGNLSGPMVRFGSQDYFVYEPALLDKGNHPRPVMVTRWFLRKGSFWGRGHPLLIDTKMMSYAIDGSRCEEFPCSDLLLSYPVFAKLHAKYALPSPSVIQGEVSSICLQKSCVQRLDKTIEPWDQPLPNRWRTRAAGKRVFTPPVSMYCDDTSGNKSKKWNKHNSYLMTLAGLEPKYAHLMYNIHFLATSNVSPPLEMLEKIVDMLVDLRENGVEAYDWVHKELVIIAPWILAELGDNPMQSELAAHIGMRGRCYCRVCCYNQDSSDRQDEQHHVAAVLRSGIPRTKADTRAALMQQLQAALNAAPTRVPDMNTATGVKDQYFEHFYQKLSAACSREKKAAQGDADASGSTISRIRATLRALRDTMPADLFNPGLRIPDLDPNSDTPVEVLHTVLLGFVKYFWRDAISRQSSEGKERLKQRLSSLGVFDLGLPPLRGHTLVQWAGSLTGKDFRIIIQVAPAVLYDAVSPKIYEAWLALSRLAALLFRPKIYRLEEYLATLEGAIDDFLACTALWSIRWFNKPKFHILLHLPLHIRRFGPAILFATEAFESYNAVIRLRSINSNRHAPGHDIAHRFSHLHAVRHLLSGGIYFARDDTQKLRPLRAGPGARSLLCDPRLVHMMGMDSLNIDDNAGAYTPVQKEGLLCWQQTSASAAGLSPPESIGPSQTKLLRCASVVLANGDTAHSRSLVLVRQAQFRFARIEEILADAEARCVIAMLVSPWSLGEEVLPYRLPAIRPATQCAPSLLRVDVSPVLLCAYLTEPVVHTFHNCHRQQCRPTKTRKRKQERIQLEQLVNEYQHNTQPDDLVLNLGQLRSAEMLDEFRSISRRYPDISKETIIEQAVENSKHEQASTDPDTAFKKPRRPRRPRAPPTQPQKDVRTSPSPASHTPVTSTSKRGHQSVSEGDSIDSPNKRARLITGQLAEPSVPQVAHSVHGGIHYSPTHIPPAPINPQFPTAHSIPYVPTNPYYRTPYPFQYIPPPAPHQVHHYSRPCEPSSRPR
ncbi:hypothetical protein GGF50DRAFT_67362 [Schizophyllum commune]